MRTSSARQIENSSTFKIFENEARAHFFVFSRPGNRASYSPPLDRRRGGERLIMKLGWRRGVTSWPRKEDAPLLLLLPPFIPPFPFPPDLTPFSFSFLPPSQPPFLAVAYKAAIYNRERRKGRRGEILGRAREKNRGSQSRDGICQFPSLSLWPQFRLENIEIVTLNILYALITQQETGKTLANSP